MPRVAILDVDGTLVDTNYHHTLAWYRALAEHGCPVPVWRIHRHIGMGGDQIVAALVDEEFEERCGEAVRETEGERYMELIDEVRPLPGAKDLLDDLRDRNCRVVLASSAKEHEVEHYVKLLDAADLERTTSADVEATKPEPDLVLAALEKVGGGSGVMIGDSTWDCKAAARAGLPTYAVMTGGFGEDELREAGAREVFGSLAELRAGLDAVLGAD